MRQLGARPACGLHLLRSVFLWYHSVAHLSLYREKDVIRMYLTPDAGRQPPDTHVWYPGNLTQGTIRSQNRQLFKNEVWPSPPQTNISSRDVELQRVQFTFVVGLVVQPRRRWRFFQWSQRQGCWWYDECFFFWFFLLLGWLGALLDPRCPRFPLRAAMACLSNCVSETGGGFGGYEDGAPLSGNN